MACFIVDNETADKFRDAVRNRYGKESWGKIKKELKTALDNHAESLKEPNTVVAK